MTRNEIRTLEDMDPVEDGDEFLHSVQWQENAPEPPEEPDPADAQDDEAPMAALLDGGSE